MMSAFLVVSFMFVFRCHMLEGSPAVGVVGGVVNMNMTISDRDINTGRNLKGPNNVVLLEFTVNDPNPAYIDDNVTYTGYISGGFVSFTLSHLTRQSAGIYQYIIAKGNRDVIDGVQYLVIAESPNTPIISGLSQQAVAGGEYKLNCSAVSRSEKPGHNLTMFSEWKRNGVNIMADTKYGVDGTILTIKNLNRNDNTASLTCIAFDDQRMKSPESMAFPLNVYYGPDSITLSPSQMSFDLPENSSLNVNCLADCVPSCQYRWTGPGGSYPGDKGILSISKISRSQAGMFTCTAYNPNIASNSATVTASVTVQYPPVVSINSRNGTYNDTDIALNCSARGVPEQYVFALTHISLFTGTMIRHPSFDNVSTGVIRYRFSNFMDTGIYTCTVNNGVADYIDGSVNTSVSETVWIKGPPNVTSINSSFHAEKGQSGRLAIEFYNSLLDPSVTWYRDRNQSLEKLDSSDKYSIYISNIYVTLNFYSVSIQQPGFSAALEIRNVTPDDFGNYQVNVQNSVGVMSPKVLVLWPRDFKKEKMLDNGSDKVIIGSAVGAVVLIGLAVLVGAVIFKRRRVVKLNSDVTQINQGNAKSVTHDAANEQDYEGLHISHTDASPYLQLNGIKLEENKDTKTRYPENDLYQTLHQYTNNDIQMYSSLKIPKVSKDSERMYENTRIKATA